LKLANEDLGLEGQQGSKSNVANSPPIAGKIFKAIDAVKIINQGINDSFRWPCLKLTAMRVDVPNTLTATPTSSSVSLQDLLAKV
jgi:hypothetical protein